MRTGFMFVKRVFMLAYRTYVCEVDLCIDVHPPQKMGGIWGGYGGDGRYPPHHFSIWGGRIPPISRRGGGTDPPKIIGFGAEHLQDGISATIGNLFYFSVVVFTTVGFGDIAPIGPLGKIIVIFEGITGGVIMAILIIAFFLVII